MNRDYSKIEEIQGGCLKTRGFIRTFEKYGDFLILRFDEELWEGMAYQQQCPKRFMREINKNPAFSAFPCGRFEKVPFSNFCSSCGNPVCISTTNNEKYFLTVSTAT